MTRRPKSDNLLLEVGTIDHDGNPEPGFMPSFAAKMGRVVTVDMLRKYAIDPGYAHQMQPTSPAQLKSMYRSSSKIVGFEGEVDVTPVYADGRRLPFDKDVFGVVLIKNILSDPSVSPPDWESLVREALRVTKPGGEVWMADDRGAAENLRAFEQAFPSTTHDFTRTDNLRYGIVPPLKNVRDIYYSKIRAFDPDLYIMQKINSDPT